MFWLFLISLWLRTVFHALRSGSQTGLLRHHSEWKPCLSNAIYGRFGMERDPHPLVVSTLIRKSPTCFVRTKPRGSVVITKPLVLRRSSCACKTSRAFSLTKTVFLCRYTKVMWLCKNKGFHNFSWECGHDMVASSKHSFTVQENHLCTSFCNAVFPLCFPWYIVSFTAANCKLVAWLANTDYWTQRLLA